MKCVLLPLVAALLLPNAVNAAEVNCNSAVWKNKEICLKKKAKRENKPEFCENKKLTPIQEEECLSFKKRKSDSFKQPLEYPISFGSRNIAKYRMIEFIPPSENNEKTRYIQELIQLRSKDGSDLTIAKGKLGTCFGCKWDEISKFSIETKNVIGWSKNGETKSEANAAKTWGAVALFVNPAALFLTPFGFSQKKIDYFHIMYFDNKGIKKDFYLLHDFKNKSKVPNLIDRYLEKITSLKSGEIRSDNELRPVLLISLQNLEKEADRLEEILIEPNNLKDNCVSFKTKKFPNLYAKYQNLEKSISQLNIRLQINPVQNKKEICLI